MIRQMHALTRQRFKVGRVIVGVGWHPQAATRLDFVLESSPQLALLGAFREYLNMLRPTLQHRAGMPSLGIGVAVKPILGDH